jgi:DNA-binding MarR family transcriptional regulator
MAPKSRPMENDFQVERFLPFRLSLLAADVSERLSRIYAEPFDLDVTQWRILANLASLEHATAQEICRRTLFHKSTVSRAVQQMQDRGLIERVAHDEDKRSFDLRLTTRGQALFRKIRPLVLSFERDLLERLSPADAKALRKGLSALELELERQREAQE